MGCSSSEHIKPAANPEQMKDNIERMQSELNEISQRRKEMSPEKSGENVRINDKQYNTRKTKENRRNDESFKNLETLNLRQPSDRNNSNQIPKYTTNEKIQFKQRDINNNGLLKKYDRNSIKPNDNEELEEIPIFNSKNNQENKLNDIDKIYEESLKKSSIDNMNDHKEEKVFVKSQRKNENSKKKILNINKNIVADNNYREPNLTNRLDGSSNVIQINGKKVNEEEQIKEGFHHKCKRENFNETSSIQKYSFIDGQNSKESSKKMLDLKNKTLDDPLNEKSKLSKLTLPLIKNNDNSNVLKVSNSKEIKKQIFTRKDEEIEEDNIFIPKIIKLQVNNSNGRGSVQRVNQDLASKNGYNESVNPNKQIKLKAIGSKEYINNLKEQKIIPPNYNNENFDSPLRDLIYGDQEVPKLPTFSQKVENSSKNSQLKLNIFESKAEVLNNNKIKVSPKKEEKNAEEKNFPKQKIRDEILKLSGNYDNNEIIDDIIVSR